MDSRAYFAGHAWLPQGFARDVRIEVDEGRFLPGALLAVEAGGAPQGAEALGRFVVPGMPNLHSHAFQRAMAGLAERRGGEGDSFWTWREVMYAFAGRIGPEGETVGVQLEPLAVSREQRHVDLVFEAGQCARHVRLVDAQLRSGVARVLRLGQRQEDAEGLLVHDTDYAPIASQAASGSFPAHP